jgi:hypothetical protein
VVRGKCGEVAPGSESIAVGHVHVSRNLPGAIEATSTKLRCSRLRMSQSVGLQGKRRVTWSSQAGCASARILFSNF